MEPSLSIQEEVKLLTNESWCRCIHPEHFHTWHLIRNTIKTVKLDQIPMLESMNGQMKTFFTELMTNEVSAQLHTLQPTTPVPRFQFHFRN